MLRSLLYFLALKSVVAATSYAKEQSAAQQSTVAVRLPANSNPMPTATSKRLGRTANLSAARARVWLRLSEAPQHLTINSRGNYLAYVPQNGIGLKVINLKTKNIYSVSNAQVGAAFFWASEGFRLFYRELHFGAEDAADNIRSELRAYDVGNLRSHLLDTFPSSSGFPTLDPRDLTIQIMHDKGIKVKKIYYPGNRLAKWQVGRRTRGRKWLATQKSMLVLKNGGMSYSSLADDGSGIESYSIANNGQAVLWATKAGNIYLHQEEGAVRYIGHGRDPRWHPKNGDLYAYSKARFIGHKLVDYDLHVANVRGNGRDITYTPHTRERFPMWRNKGKQLLFTRERTTDIYFMNLTKPKSRDKTVARN